MSDVKGKTGAVLRETAVLTGAVAIIAAGVFFFLVPSHTSVSSISGLDRKSTRLNSSHANESRMPSSA